MPRKGLEAARQVAPSAASFNEAEAVMPRKGSLWSLYYIQQPNRFNEAEAVMPRKGRRPRPQGPA